MTRTAKLTILVIGIFILGMLALLVIGVVALNNDLSRTVGVVQYARIQRVHFVAKPVAKPISRVDAGGYYHVNSGYETFTVCVPQLAVKNNPGPKFPALSYLHEGDQVTAYEQSKGILGWVLIDGQDTVKWVEAIGLCR